MKPHKHSGVTMRLNLWDNNRFQIMYGDEVLWDSEGSDLMVNAGLIRKNFISHGAGSVTVDDLGNVQGHVNCYIERSNPQKNTAALYTEMIFIDIIWQNSKIYMRYSEVSKLRESVNTFDANFVSDNPRSFEQIKNILDNFKTK